MSDSQQNDTRYFVDISHNAATGWWEWELRQGREDDARWLISRSQDPPTSGTAWTRRRAVRKARRALRRYLKARERVLERVEIAA